MAGKNPDITYTSSLIGELKKHIAERVLPLQGRTFYVFDQDDMEAHLSNATFPFVGVMFLGMEPVDADSGGNPARDLSRSSAVMQELHIALVVVDSYPGAGIDTDNESKIKHSITDLLDDTRHAMLGFQGTNKRPWRWSGESPLPTSIRDAVMYSQQWRTKVVLRNIQR